MRKSCKISINWNWCLITEVSEFVDDNASTTETDDNKASEEIEEIEDDEGMDGVSSEGEKTSGGTETIEVNNVILWKQLLFSKDSNNNQRFLFKKKL